MKKTLLFLALAATLGTTTAIAHADDDEGHPAISHRHGIYTIAGGHMKAIKSILIAGFDAPKDVSFHAQGIADAFSHMGDSYPPGSDRGKTKAKPEIWTQGDKVKELGKNAIDAATELAKVSVAGDKETTMAAFKKLGGACKACHDDFKKK
ncbi:MAG: cytochrome c [Magnetococcales bacterium]|nr:cytochrome c [Magnetococcales bacterium]